MVELFTNFWWILFPLAGFAFGGWGMFLRYRRQKAVLDLIRSYVENGREPPASLLARIDSLDDDHDGWMGDARSGSRTPTNYWSLVGLFGVMTVGFGVAAFMGLDGGGGAFVIVALTMAAVGVWALICALMQKRDGGS